MASQAFTFFQTGNLTPDSPTTLTPSIAGTNWTNLWVNATSGRDPTGYKVTTYATATPGTPIQTTNIPTVTNTVPTLLFPTLAASAINTFRITTASFTAAANSVIVLFSGVEHINTTSNSVSTIAGLGLAWTSQYKSGSQPGYNGGAGRQQEEIWYAINNTDNSISGTITITYLSASNFDAAAVIVSSFSGCDLSNPWLSDGGAITSDASGTPTVTLPAINRANTLALAFSATTFTPPIGFTTGWTSMNSISRTGSSTVNSINLWVSYNTFTSSQGAQSLTTTASGVYWVYMTSVLVGKPFLSTGIKLITITAPPTVPALITSVKAQASSTNVCSVSSFTANAGSIIVIFSAVENTGATSNGVSSISGLGLTWIQQNASGSQPAFNAGAGRQQLEIWYAINKTAVTSTGTITVNYTATFDAQTMIVSSFSGCNLTTPWMGNGTTKIATNGFPALATTLPAISVAGTLSLAFAGTNAVTSLSGYTTSWSNLNFSFNTTATYREKIWVSYLTSTTTSAATTIAINGGSGSIDFLIYMTSVLVGASATNGSSSYSYGTQYGITVQTSNIQGKLSPAVSAVATWLAQPTFSSVTMNGLTFTIVPATTTGATGYLYTITDTGYNTNTTGATSGSFTGCVIGSQYYANVYAIATNSQSILSANSASVWCLATPVITFGTGTNNIYSSGTRIVGTTFTVVWTAGDANATSYTINLNGTGTQNTTASTTTTYAVSVNASYYAIVKATATNSTSQTTSTATIYCLTIPTITEGGSATYIAGSTFYIAWTPGDANASGYTLYINGGYNSTLPSSPLSTSLSVTIGSSYYATLYATASYSTSAASTNSSTIYCLATPTLTVGSGTNNIYNSGTYISGRTFTATWSTITNATGYTVVFTNLNTAVTTTYSPTGLTQTQSVTAANRYYVSVTANAAYSRSTPSANSSTIYCLTAPSSISGSIFGSGFSISWSQGDGNASGYTIFLNGTGTPNTTNSSTFSSSFTVSLGSSNYATVYATASYSTSSVTTTATIPCILLTFTVSMLGTTLTASVAATPNGYSYSYSVLTLYKNNVITSPAVTGSPFTGLLPGSIYSVAASATATNSASGTVVSVSVPCIGFTWTLSISATSLTGAFIMSPSGPSYPYTYTSFILNTNGSATATTSTLDAFGFLSYTVAAGNYYSISTSASVTNSNSGTQTSEILYCLAAPTITVTLTSTSLTSTAVSTNPSGITLTYTYTLYSGVPGSGSVVGSSNTTGSFTISGTSYYIVVYSSYSSTRLSTISATTQTIQPLFGTISFTASTSLSVAGSCIGATTLTFTLFSSSSEAGTFTQVGTAYVFTGTSTTRVFTSLIGGTVYNVRLSATNGTSTTSILSSNYWCIAAPTSFSVTSMSLTTVNFSWTQPSGANSYTLTYGSSTQTLTGSSGSLTISSLTNNTNYLCSLKATNTLYYSSGINSSASGTLYFAFIVVSGTTVSYNWVAPATLTYTIRIAGAAGQNAPNGNAGGRGGILTVSKSITTSTSVPVTIGTGGGGTINQSGNSNPNADGWGGVPGGGTGYGRSSGGGGGYTQFDVCIGGGGGGGGGCAYSGDGSTGGAGGGTTGATGGVGSLPSPNSRTIGGGAGGSQSAGGAGGTVTNPLSGFDGNQAANGANGSSLLGGNGGNSNGGDGNGGGGGGGYYGGGGGSGFQIPYSSAHTGGGGGGGSSYYPNTYTLISNGQGTGPSAASGNMGIGGNGYVLINS